MPSLRILANCIGLGADFSVLRDYYGFFRGQIPPDPTGASVTLSLKRDLTLLEGQHFNANMIAVPVDQFTDADDIEIDYSILRLRNIYATVSVGVGRILHFGISASQAGELATPNDRDDLEELTERFTVNNNGLDVFLIRNMNIPSDGGMLLGRSAVNGSCDKNSKGLTGSCAGLFGSEQTSRTVAHEIGHYLSLEHKNSERDNLMCQSGQANSIRNSVQLTSTQGNDVVNHCFVEDRC
jgi:hypothetical protein